MEDAPKRKMSKQATEEEKYYMGIRAAFSKRRDEIDNYGYTIKIGFLKEYLKKYYKILCDEKTLRQLFDVQCRVAIKPHLIVAMCNILGIDLYSVIQYP